MTVLALATCGGVARAQSKGPDGGSPATQPATKIGAINLRAAIANTAEGKQAAAQLDAQFAPRRKEIEDLNKQIGDLQQKLSAGAPVLNDAEREKLTLQGQKLTRQLDRRQNEFQEDLTDAQNEVVQRIGRRLVEVIAKYAPNNGYSAVLDDSANGSAVMYASTDITQDIVKLYDQTYPAKASNTPAPAKPSAKADGAKPSGQ
jgi:outer membrane protein